ncbi:MAG: transglutaminase domain-containing protein [Taibaiella sp.]|nr:transglutaminase domain-containing protein [Taibaiella sp.]
MSNARMNIRWQRKVACLIMAAVGITVSADAQLSLKRQKYDSIAARYSGEHAIYTEVTERIEFEDYQGDGLYAKATTSVEELFISDKSLNKFHEAEPNTAIYIPEGNDYKRYTKTYHPLTRNAITYTTSTDMYALGFLPGFYFSQSLPVVSATLEVIAPKNMKMGFMVTGGDTSVIKRSVTEKYGNIIYRFTAENVPAQKPYSNVPSDKYYRPHVIPYVISFRPTGAKKDSVMSGSVEADHKYEFGYIKGRNLEHDEYLENKAKELTKSAYSQREKVQRIYDWVQNNFHYRIDPDNPNWGVVPHQADTVCKRMFGDCKDMSSVFNAMLDQVGVKAYYVVIGTNDKPYAHNQIQNGHLYDHMIAAVKLDGEWVFLDGTTHVMPMGYNRSDLQGKEANILVSENESKIVTIPTMPASQNVETDNTTINLDNDKITGTIYAHYSGYGAWDLGEYLEARQREYEKDKIVQKLLSRGNNKFVVRNYSVNQPKSGRKDASIDARFTLDGYVQTVKRDHYVNMNVLRTMEKSRVNEPERNVAFYLQPDYKRTVKQTVTLNVPKGYHVSYIPKSAKGGNEKLWTYSITYKYDAKARTITLTKEYVVNVLKIDPDQFAEHNKLVDELNKQYKETVVLTGK